MSRIERIHSDRVGEPPAETWSNCLRVGNQVFIAGMTARGAEFDAIDGAGAYEQAGIIFTKIKHLIEAAGGRGQRAGAARDGGRGRGRRDTRRRHGLNAGTPGRPPICRSQPASPFHSPTRFSPHGGPAPPPDGHGGDGAIPMPERLIV